MTVTVMEVLGASIPPLPHAISVSLPTWRDNIGYEEGEKRVVEAMCTGYPRFFIHKSIQKLAAICEARFGRVNVLSSEQERCMLYPSARVADECRSYMLRRDPSLKPISGVRIVRFLIHPEVAPRRHAQGYRPDNFDSAQHENSFEEIEDGESEELYIVLFPASFFPLAKQFWQHTGLFISSRFADKCLSLLDANCLCAPTPQLQSSPQPYLSPPTSPRPGKREANRHYAKKTSVLGKDLLSSPQTILHIDTDIKFPVQKLTTLTAEALTQTHRTYLEERYGRNMPLSYGTIAKSTLRHRIAGVLLCDPFDTLLPPSPICVPETGPSNRGIRNLTEDDVYLFPTGMAAIWSAYQVALGIMPSESKSVCFGFPYTDTLKILQKWGPGCYHFGHGTLPDLEALTSLLASNTPISSLFCEFPSNPLLRSPPLRRLRELADQYGFLIIVDDTVGNFANVEVLPHADMVVSGLTKVFSGDANVMGGSLVVNPESKHYTSLKSFLAKNYEDVYYSEDAIFLERNSRDFARRVHKIDANTLLVTAFLHSHSQNSGNPDKKDSVLKKVWYPTYETTEWYEECRIQADPTGRRHEGGYGGLFSVTFTSLAASQAFFDTLQCAKGPSLGTNFTLACPYTILAHYAELDWAAQWGVDKDLVRVSVGLEDGDGLLEMFGAALDAAKAAAAQ